MADENPQQPNTGDQPSQAQQKPAGQLPASPQGQNTSGQRRTDRRDHSRYHSGRRDHHQRDQQPSPRPGVPEKPAGSPGKDEDIDDEEETERDRSSPQGRHHRGGRPPKKIIEEWANDPYCE